MAGWVILGWVYEIRNTVTGRVYIGSTQDSRRFKRHRVLLLKGSHYNKSLQADWNTYGEAVFTMDVIDEVEGSSTHEGNFSIRLRATEEQYIAQAKAVDGVYDTQAALGKFWGHVDVTMRVGPHRVATATTDERE